MTQEQAPRHSTRRTVYPGVRRRGNKWVARMPDGRGGWRHLGMFRSEWEAWQACKKARAIEGRRAA